MVLNMEAKLKALWAEAQKTGKPVSVSGIVVCDICDKDFTELDTVGGFIFTSSAYCPECEVKGMRTIKGYGEERFIKAVCQDGVSFADFVRAYRGQANYIQISKGGDDG